jgi:hypothetical protein
MFAVRSHVNFVDSKGHDCYFWFNEIPIKLLKIGGTWSIFKDPGFHLKSMIPVHDFPAQKMPLCLWCSMVENQELT